MHAHHPVLPAKRRQSVGVLPNASMLKDAEVRQWLLS